MVDRRIRRLKIVMGLEHRFCWINKVRRRLTGKIGAGHGSNVSASFSMKEAFSHKSTVPAGKQT